MLFIRRELKVKREKIELEPQEVLLDALTQKKEEEGHSYKLEVPLRRRVIFGFWLLFLIFISIIFVRTFQLQIINHNEFLALAEKNQFIFSLIKSQRGVIYDRNFNQLVFNQPSFNLICKKSEFLRENENPDATIKRLASIFKIDPKTIQDRIAQVDEPEIVLLQNLGYQSLVIFEGLSQELPGFYIENENIREYKDGLYSSHILGYHRRSEQNTGLEGFYDEILSSVPGKIAVERDARGRIISERVESLAEPGDSLVLWMDAELQKKLFQELSDSLKRIGSVRGAAIAMDPNTGGILAMVSLPSFDNNLFAEAMSEKDWQKIQNDKNFPLLNRAISGRYPTGSTIKPLVAAAALEEEVITPQTTINCQGEIVIENPWFEDKPSIYKDWKTHGITAVKKAIAESCNVFFYTIGGGDKKFKGLGVDKLKQYFGLFGWGEGLGIDLPGEKPGFIPDIEWKEERYSPPDNIWYLGDTYNLSIGQGYLKINPLEVVTAFSAIANGGKLLKPQIVKAIVDEDKDIIKEFEPQVIRQGFIDEEHINTVKKGMREAVIYGSSAMLAGLPVKAASKTGTAEIGKKEYYHNWVTVFAPYDEPEIVITILAEDVKGMHVVALPVAKNVLNWYFQRDKVEIEE